MNIVYGALLAAAAGVGVYVVAHPQPADEYPLALGDAYHKLETAQLVHGHKGAFGGLETSISGNGRDQLSWKAGGTFAAFDCTLKLAPLGEARTKVAVSCDGGGGGAATGLLMTMTRNAVIEQIDSTLKNRPYDIKLAEGGTAYRWPEDVVHHADFNESVGKAVQMGADIADENAKAEQQVKNDEAMRDSANVGRPSLQTAPVDTAPNSDEGSNP